MLQTKIEKLTPEQEALIPVTLEKWRAIALSTEPIDRQKASEVVKAAYELIGKQEPEILFFNSPYEALSFILSKQEQLGSRLEDQLKSQLVIRQEIALSYQLESMMELESRLDKHFKEQLKNSLVFQLMFQLRNQLKVHVYLIGQCIYPLAWIEHTSWFDFCINVLNCNQNRDKWEIIKSLVKQCGCIYPFENTCIVCDRPRILSLDNEQRLHAEGSPALQFTDGYSLYSYHGVTLPEKYGKLHPNEWRASLLLEEDNAELRRVLIQGIGYERICQELQAIELDTWQEYTLLKIDNNGDLEPIYLLRMTCPSTGFIHVLRVPPDTKSAREAIRWVNWGIAPEEFQKQT